MKRATRRAARVAARGGQNTPRRRDAVRAREEKMPRRVKRARRVGLGAARDRSRARDRRGSRKGRGTRDGRARGSRRVRAAYLGGAVFGGGLEARAGAGRDGGHVGGGVWRLRARSACGGVAASASLALEFKTPREPLRTTMNHDVSLAWSYEPSNRIAFSNPVSRFASIYGSLVSYFRERGES